MAAALVANAQSEFFVTSPTSPVNSDGSATFFNVTELKDGRVMAHYSWYDQAKFETYLERRIYSADGQMMSKTTLTDLNRGSLAVTKNSEGNLFESYTRYDASNFQTRVYVNQLNASLDSSKGIVITEGGFSAMFIEGIAPTSDGGFLISMSVGNQGSYGEELLVKLDKNLKIEWRQLFASPDVTYSLPAILETDDAYFLAGYNRKGFETYPVVIKFSKAGSLQWVKSFTSVLHSIYVNSLVQDKNGDIWALGDMGNRWGIKLSLAGDSLGVYGKLSPDNEYYSIRNAHVKNGNIYFAGANYAKHGASTSSEIMFGELDPSGTLKIQQQYHSSAEEIAPGAYGFELHVNDYIYGFVPASKGWLAVTSTLEGNKGNQSLIHLDDKFLLHNWHLAPFMEGDYISVQAQQGYSIVIHLKELSAPLTTHSIATDVDPAALVSILGDSAIYTIDELPTGTTMKADLYLRYPKSIAAKIKKPEDLDNLIIWNKQASQPWQQQMTTADTVFRSLKVADIDHFSSWTSTSEPVSAIKESMVSNQLQLLGNPVTGGIIQLKMAEEPAGIFEVMAMDGRVVSKFAVSAAPGAVISIPTGPLSSGTYLLRFIGTKSEASVKFECRQ